MSDIIYELFCYLLFQPVPLFPSYSGVCLGWLSHLGRTFCSYSFMGYVLVFGHMLWSLTVSFFYRYRILAPTKIRIKLEHEFIIPALFVLGLIGTSLPIIALGFGEETDYNNVRQVTLSVWPNYTTEIDNFVLFGAKGGLPIYLFIALVGVLLLANTLIAITLAILINKELKKQAHIMSKNTQTMHKTLSNILLAQILLPVGFVFIPVLICISFVVFNYANKDLIWASLTPLTLYPLISNVIFLYFSNPHRKAFVRLVKLHILRRKENVVVLIPTYNNSALQATNSNNTVMHMGTNNS